MSDTSRKNEILCVCGIHWVKDIDKTLLINVQHGKTFILRGLESTVWDWITLNFPYGKIAQLLATMLESTLSEAEARLKMILHQWVENGLLVIEENDTHD